jgi:hypothetical protein
MTLAAGGRGQSKGLVLTAMIFAVAMTFIDQTIMSIIGSPRQHAAPASRGTYYEVLNSTSIDIHNFPRDAKIAGITIQ